MDTKTLCLAIVLSGCPLIGTLRGDDVFWDGETSSDWQTGTNWQPQCPGGPFCVQQPPGVGDNAILQNVGPLGSKLARLSDDVSIDILAIRDGVTVNANGHSLHALHHTHVEGNSSSLVVPDAPNNPQAFFSYALDVTDGGRVELGGLGQPGATVEIGGPESTISGASSLGGNGGIRFYNYQGDSETVLLDNNGTIRPLHGTLSLLPVGASGGVFDLDGSNEIGVLDVDDGSFLSTNVRLNIDGPLTDPFHGRINIGEGDRVHFSHPWQLGSADHAGGIITMNGNNGTATLSSAAPITIRVTNSVILPLAIEVSSGTARFAADIVAVSGFIIAQDNTTVHFEGLTNLGPSTFFMGGDHYDLIVDNRVEINQANFDWDSPSPGSHDTTINENARLVINSNEINPDDNTFRGEVEINGGWLEVNTATSWTLEGRMVLRHTGGVSPIVEGEWLFVGDGFDTGPDAQIEVTGPGNSAIFPTVRFRRDAELEIDSGAGLILWGTAIFDPGAQIDGPGSLIAFNGMSIADGIVIDGQLRNVGTLHVGGGNQTGKVTVGDYTHTHAQLVGGHLSIELEGTAPGEFDQLIVTGDAMLDGTLAVEWLGAGPPNRGDQFPIITAASVSGMFETLLLPPVADGDVWNIQYNPTSVILEVVPEGLPGDYNGNGTVDAADYVVWRDTLGSTTNLAADGNGTNEIDPGDYAVWKTNFGQSSGSGSATATSTAVPEPLSCCLMMLGLSIVVTIGRR